MGRSSVKKKGSGVTALDLLVHLLLWEQQCSWASPRSLPTQKHCGGDFKLKSDFLSVSVLTSEDLDTSAGVSKSTHCVQCPGSAVRGAKINGDPWSSGISSSAGEAGARNTTLFHLEAR